MENLHTLTPKDELKFVLSDRADYEFARDFVRQHQLHDRVANVILSPAFRKDATGRGETGQCLLDPLHLAEWMLADALPARLGLQMHKFIWDASQKGV